MTAIENCSGDSVTTAGTSQFTVQVCVFIISVYLSLSVYQCDNDPGSHKEVHKNWSEVGVQKDVYLEQMCK